MNIGKKLIVGALAVVGAWCAQAEEKCTDCITFSADKSFGIRLNKGTDKSTPTVTLEYSTDQLNWKTFNVDTGYDAAQDGETYKLHIRGTGNSAFSSGVSVTKSHSFTNTVGSAATAIACSGNVLTLLDYGKVAKGEEPTMNDYAFYYLFSGFAALTAAPALPATTLAKSCYRSMFLRCTSLTAAPALPATTLASSCYQGMFKSCTSLTAAPALPATTMTGYCYQSMFYRCTSLTAAPALPATTLAANCYQDMFYGCTSLTAAPALPATTLPESCYGTMFLNCSSLKVNTAAPGKEWKIAAAPGTGVTTWGKNMFTGTGGDVTGTPDLNTTYYIASAPKETDCITFSADKSFGIRLNKGTDTTTPTVKLEYSTDQLNWQTFNVDAGYDAAQDGETYKLHIRGTGNSTFAAGASAKKAHCFTNTVGSAATAIACSGNIMTLLDYETVAKGEEPTMNDYAFYSLFYGFAALTSVPALPATTLAKGCYRSMFQRCTLLTAAPALPATTLADFCYNSMFLGCTSLTAAPALNATTLTNYCYQYMFQDCTSLTDAPALPATTLAGNCYYGMFYRCTSLTAVPALPATTLQIQCYNHMFSGCTSLVVNTAAPGKEWKIAATPGEGVTSWGTDMFKGTGGDVTGAPDLNTTYYVGAKKEVVGDVTLYRYGDQVGVSVAGELTKAMADSIKDQGITNLVIGAGVTGVGAGAFEGWRSLRDVTISADCTAIGADAFHRCQNVTNVTVQADETVAVGDYAFYRCNSLEKLSFAHLPSWGEMPFSFYSAIYMKDGIPEVYAIPTVEAGTAKQKLYGTNKLEGKSTEWTEIETEEQKTQFHFFKIALEM